MHIYIYDSFLAQKRYNNLIAKIETKITDLGLNGKIIRLNLTNSVYDAIENEVKRGAKTIIAVGGDSLFSQILNSMAILKKQKILNNELPLGYIPIKDKSKISHYFGIKNEEQACNIISARRCVKINLGLANNNFFLSQAVINSKNTIINIDDEYSIETNSYGQIFVINIPIYEKLPKNFNFTKKQLKLFISLNNKKNFLFFKKNFSYSIFYFKKLLIFNPSSHLIIDNSISIPTPVEIKTAKENITLIVGKDRSSFL